MDQEWSPIFKIFDVHERSLQNACFAKTSMLLVITLIKKVWTD